VDPRHVPELVMMPGSVDPSLLELYRFEPVNGRREILIKKKRVVAEPYHVTALPTGEKGVYRLRVV
jgi:hypothetical protein